MDLNESSRIIETVKRLKSGNQQAFEELYNLTHNRVYFLALKVVRNREDALEVVQETYISVYKSLDKLLMPEVFNAWLSKIVINKCKDCLSRRKETLLSDNDEFEDRVANEVLEDASGNSIPHEVLDRAETRNMVMALIDGLPAAQRAVILLYYYQGLSVNEIASAMECPVATVKSRLIYARRQIKTGVEGYEAKGVKLYNIAIVPLIIFLLEEFSKENVIGPAAAAQILSAVGAKVHTVTAVAAKTTIGASKVSLMGKIAALSLPTKIAAGVVAGAVAITAIVVPVAVIVNNSGTATPVSWSLPNTSAGQSSASKSKTTDVVNTVGNTTGNIANYGDAAQQGDWIYYSNLNDNECLYKIRTDGTGKTKVNSDSTWDINVIGDLIYYEKDVPIQGAPAGFDIVNIYKIRTDGTGETKVDTDNAGRMQVVGDWIYYLMADDHYICKMHTDGTGKTVVGDDKSSDMFCVSGDWIYYYSYTDYGKSYKMRTDGTGNTKLSNNSFDYINVAGDWIYYIYYTHNGGHLCKMRTDGTGETIVINDNVEDINVVGDWIYYVSVDDLESICKVRTDGTGKTVINSDHSQRLNIAGDWIYYTIAEKDTFYRIHTDGTGRDKVN